MTHSRVRGGGHPPCGFADLTLIRLELSVGARDAPRLVIPLNGRPRRLLRRQPRDNRRSIVNMQKEGSTMVYAIVRAGGHQEKVSVGDIITVNRMKAKAGDSVELDAVLLVDGETVTTDAEALSKVSVSAEVAGELRGPKIVIQKYKNKTGYKKRQGHRQDLTRLKITSIK